MKNPYIFRGPVHDPAMFFGRVHELNEIAAFLRGNQSVSIVGPRKIGKTSLLFHLMRPAVWPELGVGEETLFVYLDCEVLGESGASEIFAQFAAEIDAAMDERALPPEPALERMMENPSRLAFEAAIRKLNQRGLRIVLILDEFERLSNNASLDVNFFNALRSAAGRYKLAFVTASATPLIQLTYSGRSQEILSSPFFNIFAPLFLGLMPEEEARQLIRGPVAAQERPEFFSLLSSRLDAPTRDKPGFSQKASLFPSDVEDFLYGLAGGHPLALQVACFHAFDSPDNLEEVEKRAMAELTPHFQYYWQNLTPDEQRTLRQLSDAASRAGSDTTLRGILRDLVQKCLLVTDGGAYWYPSQAWANFLSSSYVASQTPGRLTLAGAGRLSAGTRLGMYEVIDLLGYGGMAEVYKGRHPRLERTVAIKVLSTTLAGEEDFRQRFEREAQAIAILRHPNIVQVFDFGDVEGTYYMVMEYIDGIDLSRLMRDSGPLPLEWVRSIMHGLTGALDYAHAQGIIHRDVKPSNVMLQGLRAADLPIVEPTPPTSIIPILTDFGIAKIRTGDTGVTKTGMIMGTLDYMAPEQVRGAGKVDWRADIYALGVMMYQMVTGELPFQGDNPGAVMLGHLQQPPPDPRLLRADLPESVAAVILHAMAKDPEERPARAGELVNW